MSTATRLAINWVEQGLVPDAVIRKGIRRLCEQRLREIAANDCETASQLTERFVSSMDAHEIAPVPHLANEQHYEVPAEFFAQVLGPHRKYSSAWWPQGIDRRSRTPRRGARRHLRARRARRTARRILELGCGWGSLTLWMAERFPRSHVTGSVEFALAARVHPGARPRAAACAMSK